MKTLFVAIDRRIRFVSALTLTLAFVGCSREPVAEFTANAALSELPELHQTDIHDGLARLFGTSVIPRMRIADPDAPEPEEGEPTPLIEDADPRHLKHGATVYNARCAGCHGITGDGAGPAGEFLRPRPRDYRKGTFKFTSTPYGHETSATRLGAGHSSRCQGNFHAGVSVDVRCRFGSGH